MTSSAADVPNHLMHEKSPYLLQHAYNPVDWYPWGEEAFALARKENKPILISIGYSTCHWCHVMERESYEDPKIGALMNHYFVNIKVDREERPDVDRIYMTAVSAMTGSGGWPLNVFVTPDLKPFFGGTYFPPQTKWGQPAWSELITQIGESWAKPADRQKMISSSDHIVQSLQHYMSSISTPMAGDAAWMDQTFEALQESYDSTYGGFGDAPKFPMPVNINFLLRYYARTKNKDALDMIQNTLGEMAKGGLYDQLGGGFARYSTDERWHVPHFEKMLYDNAQLAVNYLETYQLTRLPELARIARETLIYIGRDMTHPDGGFYSAEDADSLPAADSKEKTEGAFYVWEQSEIIKALGPEIGKVFCFRYGIRDKGNALTDPHGEFTNKNILYRAHTTAETAREMGLKEDDVIAQLADAKKKLFELRGYRPRPHLDDKILSGWNGLMISAYAKGYQILGDPDDLIRAQKAASFLKSRLYDGKTQLLYRRWRDGERLIPGTADDYAFVVQGLLDLYEADFNLIWIDWAIELTDSQTKQFYDSALGGFFMTSPANDKNLLLRIKEDQDNVEPTASSVAVLNLLRLSQFTDRPAYPKMAEDTLHFYGRQMKTSPKALPQMLVALDWELTEPRQIVIAGKPGAADTQALFKVLHEQFIPVKIVLQADGAALQKHPASMLDFIGDMAPIDGKAAAYVCIHHSCKQPTSDPETFKKLLEDLNGKS